MSSTLKRIAILAGILWGACALSAPKAQAATTLMWKGIQWNVKSGVKNPGHNSWSADNAFVDADGDLHLKITNVNGTWSCAEVWTDTTFGFGTFQWQLKTSVDNLDPNVVFGMFLYGPPVLGVDGTHEIDIEYARYGSAVAGADNARWTVWPNKLNGSATLGRTTYQLPGTSSATTARFIWDPGSVSFSSLDGLAPPGSTANVLQTWNFRPALSTISISQAPMPVHMNLWLYGGNAPTDGQPVEVVIHDFSANALVTVPTLPANGALFLGACLGGVGLFALTRRSPRRGRFRSSAR